ncbi:MAG TPA: histidine phosphatase family protein [Candidatus Limnocylindrales bacterium]
MSDQAESIQLFLIRHADAGDPARWDGPDAQRPLSDKGRRQAERLGRHLAAIGFTTDAMLSSPKVRALETAELVADAIGCSVDVDDRLAGGVDAEAVRTVLREAGSPSRPVLVGHDPDFSELLADLVGAPDLSMKKGALARVDLDARIDEGTGVLRWLVPPDLLPDQSRS